MNNKKDKSTRAQTRSFDELPDGAFIRAASLPPILGFSPATLWRKTKDGTFPSPVKLSERVTAWSVGAVRRWLAERAAACVAIA